MLNHRMVHSHESELYPYRNGDHTGDRNQYCISFLRGELLVMLSDTIRCQTNCHE